MTTPCAHRQSRGLSDLRAADHPPGHGMTPRQALRGGAIAISPIMLGVIPFGVVAGLATVELGVGLREVFGFSIFFYAGAAQLAALNLLSTGAGVAVALGTAIVINLRLVMYSASIAPYLAEVPRPRRMFAAYMLTDQAYAVSVARYEREEMPPAARLAFLLGSAGSMWIAWQFASLTGALVGDLIPDGLPLGFAVPMAFLSLLIPSLTDRPALAAAVTGASVATLGTTLPAGLGMPLGAFSGVLVGWILVRRAAR